MNYLALGDSISIDDYTGVPGGGAARQFANLIDAQQIENLTYDGCTTNGVLGELGRVTIRPNIVTLTAGGNDFLQIAFSLVNPPGSLSITTLDDLIREPLDNLTRISERLAAFGCPVIINTVYDPTDGDDVAAAAFGLRPEARRAFNVLNDGIRALAKQHGFLLSDLETLFHGHGVNADDTWITLQIEPNYAGATATARHWLELYRTTSNRP